MTPDSDRVQERLLDLLVDGELDERDRRLLLARLETEPGGWRRCALAFLEAQCWRDVSCSLAELARPAVRKPPIDGWDSEGLLPLPPARQPSGPLARWAGTAAGVFAAFILGLATSAALRSPAATTTAVTQFAPPAIAPEWAAPDASNALANEEGGMSQGRAFAFVRVGPPGGTVTEVPIMAGTGFDEEWLDPSSHALPQYIVRQWNQQGFQVEKRSRLVSMGLPGGQRVAIPLEEVKLHFVGKPTY
ncbi:MAG TPA: hypothetical protein VGY53_05825 [Isosphaeraceae bacterium]|nr:hypothetical protein [Isosphaeraceae bacterium]